MVTHSVKTVLIIVGVMLAYYNVFAAITLIEDKGSKIVLHFKVPDYALKNVVIAGKKCSRLKVSEGTLLSKKGYPALPYFFRSVVIPGDASMGYEIVDVKYTQKAVATFLPSRGVIYRNQNVASIPYTFADIYLKDTWYPEEPVKLGEPYIMRGIRGLTVYFYPFRYNAARGVLKIAESVTVIIKQTGISTKNVLSGATGHSHGMLSALHKNHFINYPKQMQTRYDPIADGEGMVVVTASSYASALEPLVTWKNQKGIKTRLYEYPSETGGSGTAALQGFIKEMYQDSGIMYVLLVGDAEDIPSPYASGGLSDPSYTKVDGNDDYPDIFVGRFSVETVSQATAMVNKVLKYEKEPDPDGDWYHKAIGHGSDEGSPPDYEWIDDIRDAMLTYTYTVVDKVYQNQSGNADIPTSLNDGRGWYNYMGHGGQTYFGFSGGSVSNSTFEALTNTNMLPVIISVACNNGEFDVSGECIAECATRLDSTGTIAYLGSYISQPWTPPQYGQKEMNSVLCAEEAISLGGIIYNGGSKILDISSSGQYLETFDTWTLFGDPSLMVYTDTPAELSVTAPTRLQTGAQNIELAFSRTIDGRVGLYGSVNGFLSGQIIQGRSDATVSVTVPANETSVKLTVTARNCMPCFKDIPVGNNSIAYTGALKDQAVSITLIKGSFAVKISIPGKHTVTLWNLQGKKLASFPVLQTGVWYTLPVSASGMHLVSVEAGNKKIMNRFVLTK